MSFYYSIQFLGNQVAIYLVDRRKYNIEFTFDYTCVDLLTICDIYT